MAENQRPWLRRCLQETVVCKRGLSVRWKRMGVKKKGEPKLPLQSGRRTGNTRSSFLNILQIARTNGLTAVVQGALFGGTDQVTNFGIQGSVELAGYVAIFDTFLGLALADNHVSHNGFLPRVLVRFRSQPRIFPAAGESGLNLTNCRDQKSFTGKWRHNRLGRRLCQAYFCLEDEKGNRPQSALKPRKSTIRSL